MVNRFQINSKPIQAIPKCGRIGSERTFWRTSFTATCNQTPRRRFIGRSNADIITDQLIDQIKKKRNEANVKRGIQGHGGGEFRAAEDPIANRVPSFTNVGRCCEGLSRKPAEDVVKNVVVHRRKSSVAYSTCSEGSIHWQWNRDKTTTFEQLVLLSLLFARQ